MGLQAISRGLVTLEKVLLQLSGSTKCDQVVPSTQQECIFLPDMLPGLIQLVWYSGEAEAFFFIGQTFKHTGSKFWDSYPGLPPRALLSHSSCNTHEYHCFLTPAPKPTLNTAESWDSVAYERTRRPVVAVHDQGSMLGVISAWSLKELLSSHQEGSFWASHCRRLLSSFSQ